MAETTKIEIAETIEKSVAARAADLSPDHLEYRRICAEIDKFEQPGYRSDDA